jgi:hypothetical protein
LHAWCDDDADEAPDACWRASCDGAGDEPVPDDELRGDADWRASAAAVSGAYESLPRDFSFSCAASLTADSTEMLLP